MFEADITACLDQIDHQALMGRVRGRVGDKRVLGWVTAFLRAGIVPAILMSFVLVGAQLFHSVLDSILMFAGLFSGNVDYTWWNWLGARGWSAFGNLLGGLVLVTSVRLLRVPHRVAGERSNREDD